MAMDSTAKTAPRRSPPTTPILILILFVALAMRLHGFNWDDGRGVHPDERAVAGWAAGLVFPHSPTDLLQADNGWNPSYNVVDHTHNHGAFAYGSLALYLIFFMGHLLQWLSGIFPWWSSWSTATTYDGMRESGRVLSAFADTLTVFLVYLMGTRLAGKVTGLYAAALATFAVLSIQLAHFTTVDTLLATFCTGTVLATLDLFTHGRTRDYVIVGIWLAAALAVKTSALPLLAPIVVAWAWGSYRRGTLLTETGPTVVKLLIAATAALVALFIFQPYMFSDWADYWAGVGEQADLASGTNIVFYTRKWAGTTPYIYPLGQLTIYSLGLPLALLSYAGVIYEAIRTSTRRRNAGVLVVLWVLAYFGSAGLLYMKYLRYMEPIVPSLCVLAAIFVSAMVRNRIWLVGRAVRPLGLALGGVVLLLTACYGLAYWQIYAHPLTRIAASRWIYNTLPAGSVLLQDNFDESLPLGGVDGHDPCSSVGGKFPSVCQVTFPTYDQPDDLAKAQRMANLLTTGNYYLISSRRAIETFNAEPLVSPYTHRFYQILLGSGLKHQDAMGFTLIKQFVAHPAFGPWTFNDYTANQNFNEYDHPPVYIFQNTGHFDASRIMAALSNGIPLPSLYATPPKSLLLTPQEIAVNQKGPTFDAMFPLTSWPGGLQALIWLLMIELLGLLALPLSMRLFGRLRDCGFVLAKTAGILIVSYLAWIMASVRIPIVGRQEYSWAEIVVSVVLLGIVSALWGVRPPDVARILRSRLRPLLLTEGAFLLAFAAFVWIRALYPDLWHFTSGGEKTMDMSFLNAIIRSRQMPPLDPWYGGGYLNYYYYGHFTVATLIKLSGISPLLSVNLAVPTFFGLALATCVSIGYNLTGRRLFGCLAGIFALVSGNLFGAQQLVSDLQALSPTHAQLHPVSSAGSRIPLIGGLIDAVSFALSAATGFVQGTFAVLLGIWQVLTGHGQLPAYAFGSGWPWDGSRILDDHKVITEYPFWTFLFADFHAHMWDIPFALCVLTLAFNFASRGPGDWPRWRRERETLLDPASEVRRSRSVLPGADLVVWPVMGILIGAVGPTNTWDLATMLGAITLSIFGGALWSGKRWTRALFATIWRVPVLLGLSLGFYAPFYTHFQSFYSSVGFTIAQHQTDLGDFFTVFGFFIFVLSSYLLYAFLTDTGLGLWIRRRVRVLLFLVYYWDEGPLLDRYFAVARRMLRLRTPRMTLEVVGSAAWSLAFCGASLLINVICRSANGNTAACRTTQGAIVSPVQCSLGFHPLHGQYVVHIYGMDTVSSLLFLLSMTAVLVSLALALWHLLIDQRTLIRAIVTAGAALIVALLLIEYWVLALLVTLLTLTVLLLLDHRRPEDSGTHFLHLLMLLGLGVAATCEVVYVKDFYMDDPLSFRNNTVFKLYEEAWLMMGIASAVAVARLLRPFMGSLRTLPFGGTSPAMGLVATGGIGAAARARGSVRAARTLNAPNGWAWGWLAFGALLFAGAMVYPLRIVPLRVGERQTWTALQHANIPPTLDGSRFLAYAYPGDYAAITWINAHIGGSPIMLQSRYGDYRNFSAGITMFTGLPTVVDWGFEASQQRYNGQPTKDGKTYPMQITSREGDVDLIYDTTSPAYALQLLHTYNVSYVYVGLQERGDPTLTGSGDFRGYTPAGLAKFDAMVKEGTLSVAYQRDGVTIYKVVR